MRVYVMMMINCVGRQQKRVVTERRREIKRLKSEQETVSYWRVRLIVVKAFYVIFSTFRTLFGHLELCCF